MRKLDKLRALVEILANELCSSGAIEESALDRQVALALDRLANAREVAAGTPVVACARCGNTFWRTHTEDTPIGRCCAACAATR